MYYILHSIIRTVLRFLKISSKDIDHNLPETQNSASRNVFAFSFGLFYQTHQSFVNFCGQLRLIRMELLQCYDAAWQLRAFGQIVSRKLGLSTFLEIIIMVAWRIWLSGNHHRHHDHDNDDLDNDDNDNDDNDDNDDDDDDDDDGDQGKQ